MASLPRLSSSRRALSSIQSIHTTSTPRATRLFHTIHHRPSPSPSLGSSNNNKHTTKKTPSTPSIRTYHSPLHPRLPPHEYTNSQTAILTASLPHIPTHGFTLAALTRGARDAGFLDVSVQLLPRGEFDLILFWLASRRGLLRGKVEEGGLFAQAEPQAQKGTELSVEEKVKILVLERLRMNADVKGVWQDVCCYLSSSLPFFLAIFVSGCKYSC